MAKDDFEDMDEFDVEENNLVEDNLVDDLEDDDGDDKKEKDVKREVDDNKGKKNEEETDGEKVKKKPKKKKMKKKSKKKKVKKKKVKKEPETYMDDNLPKAKIVAKVENGEENLKVGDEIIVRGKVATDNLRKTLEESLLLVRSEMMKLVEIEKAIINAISLV